MIIALFLASVSLVSPQELVDSALTGNMTSIGAVRAMGQPGLDMIIAKADPTNATHVDAVARVAAQHDAIHSGLFWFTNVDEAMAEAKRTKRPILSLRLLGRLDEELSCANSRFFRALLYADPSVARVMREKLVLHWQSVRPVPVVTVDMGDGRAFKTTITGNSVHMVLDENGLPVDAIPGMYTPQAFVDALEQSLVAASCPTRACVARAHQDALTKLDAAWARDMKALGRGDRPVPTSKASSLRARAIADRAMAKGIVEVPLLKQLDDAAAPVDNGPTSDIWRELGIKRATKTNWHQPALDRFQVGRNFDFMLRFISGVLADTAQNEQRHHRTIHAWFVTNDDAVSTQANFTNAIYENVFATPASDPWLGLRDVVDGAVVRPAR